MHRLFGSLKMSWPSVILFAAAAGVYTGTVMLVDVLKDTSFQDLGATYEWWVIFAVIIVVNCSRIILGLGNTIQAPLGAYYFGQVIARFPHHRLSCVVCFGSILLMSFQLQRKQTYRLISVLLPLVLTALLLTLAKQTGRVVF